MIKYVFLFLLIAGSPQAVFADDLQTPNLEKALQVYHQGEQSTTFEDRKKDFNEALTLYSSFDAPNANGKLLYNMGNCYYQLGEYPWSILYYYRAHRELPRESTILHNLSVVEKKAGVANLKESSILQNIFYIHARLAKFEKFEWFFISFLLLILLRSIAVWRPSRLIRNGYLLSGMVSLLFLLSLAINHYFSPIDAILIRPTPLYRDAGTYYAHIVDKPLLGGLKVEVLEVVSEGKWLKIRIADGTIGYVSYETIRII